MTWKIEENRLYAEDVDGALLAETTFPPAGEGVVDIDHTYVDESLRGQGIAGQMMETVVGILRQRGSRPWPAVPMPLPGWSGIPEYADRMAEPAPMQRQYPLRRPTASQKRDRRGVATPGPLGLSEPGKAHLTPIITDKRNESGGIVRFFPLLAPAGGRLPQEEGIPSAPSLPPNCIDSLRRFIR